MKNGLKLFSAGLASLSNGEICVNTWTFVETFTAGFHVVVLIFVSNFRSPLSSTFQVDQSRDAEGIHFSKRTTVIYVRFHRQFSYFSSEMQKFNFTRFIYLTDMIFDIDWEIFLVLSRNSE